MRPLRILSEALKLDKDLNLLIIRGCYFRGKGDFDAAIRDYDEAIKLDSTAADAYYERAFAWFSKKNLSMRCQTVTRVFD